MIDLKPFLELREGIEKAISESIAVPKAKPVTPTTSPLSPKPLKEAIKR